MSTSINPSQVNQFAPPPVLPKTSGNTTQTSSSTQNANSAQNTSAAGAKKLSLEAMGGMQVTGRATFDSVANVSERTKDEEKTGTGHAETHTIQKRFQRHRNTMLKTRKRLKSDEVLKATGVDDSSLEDGEDDDELRDAAKSTLAQLRSVGKFALASQLSQEYEDPLERYALLHNSLQLVDSEDIPESEKDGLKNALKEMGAKLLARYGDKIRNGLQQTEVMQNAIDKMSSVSGVKPATKQELRFLYGAKGNGKEDIPFKPMVLAKSLLKVFGNENFATGLQRIRQAMLSDLRGFSDAPKGSGSKSPGVTSKVISYPDQKKKTSKSAEKAVTTS